MSSTADRTVLGVPAGRLSSEPPVSRSDPTVAILGAGIAGLVVAYRLATLGLSTALIDPAPRPGGRVATRHRDGFVLERGPDAVLAEPAVMALCRELRLEAELVEPVPPARTNILWRGRLHPLPSGTAAGIPIDLRSFGATALLRPWERARVVLDLALPGAGEALDLDAPLGPLLRRRLGAAVVERLVEPLHGGLHGGSLDELSGGAVAPWLVELLRRGSLIRGMRRLGRSGPLPLRSFRAGMERLVEGLVAGLVAGLGGRAEWLLGRAVTGLRQGPEGWQLTLDDGSSLLARGLVLACPAPSAGQLLEGVDSELARILSTIAYGSLAVVNLAYREADLGRPPDGHGFLVPRAEPSSLRGVSWVSRKWPGRAPAGVLLARVFLDLDDGDGAGSDVLVGRAVEGLGPILAPRRQPILVDVACFAGTMPRYTVGHLGRVAAIEARRRRLPGLFLVGSAYRGAGIAELVRTGEAVAQEVAVAVGAEVGGSR